MYWYLWIAIHKYQYIFKPILSACFSRFYFIKKFADFAALKRVIHTILLSFIYHNSMFMKEFHIYLDFSVIQGECDLRAPRAG